MPGRRATSTLTLAMLLALAVTSRAQPKSPPGSSASATPGASAPAPPASSSADATPPPASSGKSAAGGDKLSAPPNASALPASPPNKPAAKSPPAAPAEKSAKPVSKPSTRKGRPPRRPSPKAPPGTPRAGASESARKSVAGGPPADASREVGDPELKALRDAERVLFPKPLPGSSPGFSWDLPRPSASPSTKVEASGLPPAIAVDPGLSDGGQGATDAEWIRSLTMPDLPVRLESPVIQYLKFYRDNPKGKAIARVWARKSGRYVPTLKSAFAKAGLPTDLVWLSLIESGHNPTIVSPAGAAGLWQFMPAAARSYGLTVDRWVDERFDPQRQTEAAIMYLSDLHRRFGNWELAMAAYNMGHAGLARAIRKFNSNDYWELCRYEAGIPWETTLYVPKIFAIAVVMSNKKAFGLDGIKADPTESFAQVVAAPGLPLARVAELAQVSTATIETLNAQYLAGRVPPAPGTFRSSFKVRVPAAKAAMVSAGLAKVGDPEPELMPHVVRMGETLERIAVSRGTEKQLIARANRLGDREQLDPGTVLLVPRRATRVAQASAADAIVVVSPREFRYSDRERVFYRVQSGDTLGKIAEVFAVTRSDLESWNSLDPTARLQPGMTLQVWIRPGTSLAGVSAIPERDARVLVAGTPEFFDYHEGQNGKKRITVEARKGDTLASVGRRYGMSVGWMERVNRRSRKKELRPGDKLVVYVRADRAAALTAADAELEPQPLPAVEPPEPAALPSAPRLDGEASAGDSAPVAEPPSAPATGG